MDAPSRRTMLVGSTLCATSALLSSAARAVAPITGQQGPGFYRYKIGSYELTALYDGTWFRKIDDSFVRNAAPADVQKAITDAFLPPSTVPISFTALLVNTGSKLILIDTGTAGQMVPTAGTMLEALAAAGVAPKAIDTILISHFHPDHINGIKTKDGDKVFPNAEIQVPDPEWVYWMDDANLNKAPDGLKIQFRNARRIFADLTKEVTRYQPGKELAPGITSIAAYGHTPGHTAFAVASGNDSMLVLSDTTNHPWLFARHPEWQASFDVDGPLAVETRKRLLDRASADKMLVQGYHFPFPASGHIVNTAGGYDLVPVMWQPL